MLGTCFFQKYTRSPRSFAFCLRRQPGHFSFTQQGVKVLVRNLPELAIFRKKRESGQSRIEHRPGLAIPPKRRSDTERERGWTRIGERGGFHGGMGLGDLL